MAAFAAAVADGADGIELDIQLSRDGVPVVLHDDTLDRTTDGRGQLRQQPLRELRRLDAGFWFHPGFAGEQLPTLEEVLAWAGERVRLNLELKEGRSAQPVLELLKKFPRVRVVVSSFNRRLLRRLRQMKDDLPVAVLSDSRFWFPALHEAVRLRAESFNPRADLVGPRLMAACQRHGIKVVPWTVDGAAAIRRMQRFRVDGMFSNDPAATLQLLGRKPLPGHSGS